MGDPRGYYDKYTVIRKETGEEVEGFHFTLIPEHDVHAVVALRAYANSCKNKNPELASDLRAYLRTLEATKK